HNAFLLLLGGYRHPRAQRQGTVGRRVSRPSAALQHRHSRCFPFTPCRCLAMIAPGNEIEAGRDAMGAAIRNTSLLAVAALAGVLAFGSGAVAQTTTPPAADAPPTADNAVLLTIFLKHDQSRP